MDTTDDPMSGSEQAESKIPTVDQNVSAGSSGDRPVGAEIILNDLTAQLNNALAREHWRDASILQHLMMDLLDLTYQNGFENPNRCRRLLDLLIGRFQEITNDARRKGPTDVVAVYEAHPRQWRLIPR
jgi:hypothetical protein